MENKYHILNGTALRDNFPSEMDGNLIAMTECLVDGPVNGADLEDLLITRRNFLSSAYTEEPTDDYDGIFVSELNKMQQIPGQSEINLWFEHDLFCQVNLWFVVDLLQSQDSNYRIYLVHTDDLYYGLGGMSKKGLKLCFQQKIELTQEHLSLLSNLWKAYQSNDYGKLSEFSSSVPSELSFIKPAIQAHIDRQPTSTQLGKPERILKEIMEELQIRDFGPVFKEFCKRAAIYGFGDLQVKRLFDQLI